MFRFGVLVITAGDKYGIVSKTKYACYLVYKLPPDQSAFEAPLGVKYRNDGYNRPAWYAYLISPNTPVIRPKCDVNTHNPLNRCTEETIPQKRFDGWMEVEVWYITFIKTGTTETVPLRLELKHPGEKYLSGLMVQGIELKPI
ncbi:kinase-like domain, phloem protein 2-like protein [Tanacetum coccineum]